MTAVAYVRISDDREGGGLGVARQETDCRRLAAANGWDVAVVLVDNDRSAYSGRRRPGYDRLLEGLMAGEWDVVVCWHPDRLHRSPKELEGFIDVLDASGATVATVTAGHWDLSTPSGRLVARQLGAVARYESEHKAERQRRKHDELFAAGRPAGGDRAFGFDDDKITHIADQADQIRWAAQHLLDGGSLRSVCARWNDLGYLTPLGNRWQPYVVRRIVTSAKVGGRRERGGVSVEAVWEPILPWETVQRLRALFADPSRRSSLRQRRYLLTGGVAVCGLCGKRLIARPKADGRRAYVCASGPGFWGCGKIRILAGDVDDPRSFEGYVVALLLRYLRDEALPSVEVDVAPLVAAIEADEASMAELSADFYAERRITRAQFQAASQRLTERITANRQRIGQAERDRMARAGRPPSAAADAWPSMGEEERRATVRLYVEAVVVHPAVKGRNFFCSDRVEVRWR